MNLHVFQKIFIANHEVIDNAWSNLQKRETFVKGQIPPYRVEFESGLKVGEFYSGEKNIHHGPLLSVHGEIGEITSSYRDLQYYYGSYLLSFRLFRPQRLEFFKTENSIELKITTLVHPKFIWLYEFINNIFWKIFGIQFLFKK